MRGIDMRAGGRGGAVGAGAPSLGSELLHADGPIGRSLSRRTVVKGAAWSVPVLMFANAAPAFAASVSVDLKGLRESSGAIFDTSLRMSTLYFATPGNDNTKFINLKCTSLKVTIKYSGVAGFSLKDATVESEMPGFGWSVDTDEDDTLVLSMDAGGLAYVYNTSQGFGGFSITFTNNAKPDLPIPETGSITVTAEGVLVGQDGTPYFVSGAVLANTTAQGTNDMVETNPVAAMVGPLFQEPGGSSNNSVVAPRLLLAGGDAPSLGSLDASELSVSSLAPSMADGSYTALGGKPITISTANGVRTVTFMDSTDAPWHFDAETGTRDIAELAAAATDGAGKKTDSGGSDTNTESDKKKSDNVTKTDATPGETDTPVEDEKVPAVNPAPQYPAN